MAKIEEKWHHYYAAAELEDKKPSTQISILLTILGESAQKIYDNMTFIKDENNDEKEDIECILKKFDKYIEPMINTIYNTCIFYRRDQKAHESFEKYVNELKAISKKCEFEKITVDEIMIDV